MTAAGLGLGLSDKLFATEHHPAFARWWEETAKRRYLRLVPGEEWVALYSDPVVDELVAGGPAGAAATAFYAAPQDPEAAERLYDYAARAFAWNDPARPVKDYRDPRVHGWGLRLARELGDDAAVGRLRAFVDERYQPTWGPLPGEFSFGFGLDEPHPRGQLNAVAMVGEVGPDRAWTDLFARPNLAKFAQPTLVGVDYPAVVVERAWYEPRDEELTLRLRPGGPAEEGRPTRFDVTALPDPARVRVLLDGADHPDWRVSGPDRITVEGTNRPADYAVRLRP